jgi:Delta7-sterol 5-desaturase
MSSHNQKDEGKETKPRPKRKVWYWHPDLPITNANMFVWPPRPLTALKELSGYWLSLTGRVVILATAILSWIIFQPSLATAVDFDWEWITHIYLRNLGIITLFATGLHLYFYTYKAQGMELRYDAREMATNNGLFTFRNQLYDNIFWTIASGVTIWTLYEVLFIWGYANKFIPDLSWDDNPVWFVALFLLIPLWYSFYFYWVHRALHWPRIYQQVHALHHRNINVGPWSGLSMHPVEHIVYLACPVIHLVIPSHPLHVIFHLQFTTLIAVFTHCGYDRLVIKDKSIIDLGYFFHQLHHRYFDCNYGTDEMPWDKWLGTFHNGTPEATELMKKKRSAA